MTKFTYSSPTVCTVLRDGVQVGTITRTDQGFKAQGAWFTVTFRYAIYAKACFMFAEEKVKQLKLQL